VLPAPPLGGAPRLRPFARARPHRAVGCEWTSETLGIGLLVGRPLAGSAISFGVLPLVEPARVQERTRRAAYTSFGPESYERFTSGSCPPSPESPVVPPGLRGGAFAPPAHPVASSRSPVRRAFARPFSPASRVRVGGRTRNRSALDPGILLTDASDTASWFCPKNLRLHDFHRRWAAVVGLD